MDETSILGPGKREGKGSGGADGEDSSCLYSATPSANSPLTWFPDLIHASFPRQSNNYLLVSRCERSAVYLCFFYYIPTYIIHLFIYCCYRWLVLLLHFFLMGWRRSVIQLVIYFDFLHRGTFPSVKPTHLHHIYLHYHHGLRLLKLQLARGTITSSQTGQGIGQGSLPAGVTADGCTVYFKRQRRGQVFGESLMGGRGWRGHEA